SIVAGRLRAPDRPDGSGGARGGCDHAGGAARALAAEEHRARDEAEDRDRKRADGGGLAGEANGADTGVAAGGAAVGRGRRISRGGRVAGGGIRSAGRGGGRGEDGGSGGGQLR